MYLFTEEKINICIIIFIKYYIILFNFKNSFLHNKINKLFKKKNTQKMEEI